jgi:hypothetical protein
LKKGTKDLKFGNLKQALGAAHRDNILTWIAALTTAQLSLNKWGKMLVSCSASGEVL